MPKHHEWLAEQRKMLAKETPVASSRAIERLRHELASAKVPAEELAIAALAAETAERRIRSRGEARERAAMIAALGSLYRSGEETALETTPSADEEPTLHPDSDHSHRLRHGKQFTTL